MQVQTWNAAEVATMRDQFVGTTSALLAEDPRTALVLADISAGSFDEDAALHPDRVINVGIREQLMVGIAGGMALEGLRPIVHTYAPFLVERAFEQVKLDLTHQGVGAVLVSIGASYDWTGGGRTHHAPGDVALVDTVPGWTIHVPGHPDEVEPLLRDAVARDDSIYIRLSNQQNAAPHPGRRLQVIRPGGRRGVVVAVGPTLDATLAATEGLDVTVAYATTVRPFDAAGLRATLQTSRDNVVIVEPYLAGTSAHVLGEALADRPHRLLSLGVRRDAEVRHYGTPQEHDALHGLDAAGIRRSISGYFW